MALECCSVCGAILPLNGKWDVENGKPRHTEGYPGCVPKENKEDGEEGREVVSSF